MTFARSGPAFRAALAVTAAAVLATAGCARFDDASASPFSPAPTFSGSDLHPRTPSSPPTTTKPKRPPGPCVDPDPAVVATCLDATGALVVLPDGNSALVAERRTGRILRVEPERDPVEIAHIDVDGSTDGGLTGLALSPTYDEDNLLYAYVTTATDNRVVRIAPGDVPKDVLAGIPKGQSDNAGSIVFTDDNNMLVLTGDAGNPAAANDPGSLAGKLLRLSKPDVVGDRPPPQVVLTGIGGAGAVCLGPGGATWVTDRLPAEDRLQKINKDGSVVSPAWSWPDRPGVDGCAATQDAVAVALTVGKAVAAVAIDGQTGTVTAAPSLVAQDRYGQLGSAAAGPDGALWVSTVNKSGGNPGPNDDRVVKIQMPGGGGGHD
ncbi:oxidoreductase [Skermania sp. ID1734]|uniref:PQQ-dependent sugar dehydrogenase n=1 Tax=Skermania sp. ID1734 TaxID=2597516 RepID=UPI00117EB45D|nr:PQQ-dependent sugar dehydrogenase [Skermania sp. ID1734]TSE01019.1 oxidoreductase [Skermania sp. ID1734]